MDCMEMLKRPLNARVAEVPPRPPPLDFRCLLSARGQGIRPGLAPDLQFSGCRPSEGTRPDA